MTIPPTATEWSDIMDPKDHVDWIMDLSPYLEEAEGIASFGIVLSAEASAAGLSISTGDRDPALVNDATQIQLWFEVAGSISRTRCSAAPARNSRWR